MVEEKRQFGGGETAVWNPENGTVSAIYTLHRPRSPCPSPFSFCLHFFLFFKSPPQITYLPPSYAQLICEPYMKETGIDIKCKTTLGPTSEAPNASAGNMGGYLLFFVAVADTNSTAQLYIVLPFPLPCFPSALPSFFDPHCCWFVFLDRCYLGSPVPAHPGKISESAGFPIGTDYVTAY